MSTGGFGPRNNSGSNAESCRLLADDDAALRNSGDSTVPFQTVGSPLMWVGFIVFVLAMLVLDLGVFHKKAHEVSIKEAALWSFVWLGLAVAFGVGVHLGFGPQRG